MSSEFSAERKKYEAALSRAQVYGHHNDRTGEHAKFSGSKGYAAVEKLYADDKKQGFKGIYCGPQATGDGYLTGPFMNLSTREMIRGGIWPVEESRESNAYFDHGNKFEEVAIDLFKRISDCEFHVPGRIDCPVPGFSWMAATPDGLCYSHKNDKAYIVEVKCPVSRKIETTEPPQTVFFPKETPFTQPVFADWDDYDRSMAGVPLSQEEKEKQENEIEDVVQGGFVSEYSWRDVDFTEITVYQHSKIPPYYLMQMLIECFSAEIFRAVFVQFIPGGLFACPEIHVTYWDFDERLWTKMSNYWRKCWEYVEEGRKKMKKLRELRLLSPEMLTEEDRKTVESLAKELEVFPWPKKKGGRGVHHIPFEFDK